MEILDQMYWIPGKKWKTLRNFLHQRGFIVFGWCRIARIELVYFVLLFVEKPMGD